MAEPSEVITAQEFEAMTAAERATVINEQLVTDLESLDGRTTEMVANGAAKVRARLQNQG